MVALQHPGEFDLLHAPLLQRLHERRHQHEPHAPGLVFGHHVRADRTHPLDALLVPEQTQEAERKQPAVNRLDPRVVVEQAESGADRLAVDLRHEGEFRHDQVAEALRHVLHLSRRERHEAPGAAQAGVVDVEKHPHLVVEAAAIERADRHAKTILDTLHHRRQLRVEVAQHRQLAPERIEVLDLPEPIGLDQLRVPGTVMRHHEEGRGVEPLDEQAALVIERGVHRPADRRHALGMKPILRRIEEAAGRLGIVVALEEAEEAPLLLVAVDVAGVHDRRDPADVHPISSGEKRPALRPLVERVRAEAEQFLLRHDERRHPAGIVAVDPPRQLDETLPLRSGVHRSNDDFRQGRLHVGG